MKTLKQKIQIKRNNNKFNRQKTKAKNKQQTLKNILIKYNKIIKNLNKQKKSIIIIYLTNCMYRFITQSNKLNLKQKTLYKH